MNGRRAWKVSGAECKKSGRRSARALPEHAKNGSYACMLLRRASKVPWRKLTLGLRLWSSSDYHSNTNRTVAPVVDSSHRLLPAVCHRILAPAVNLGERNVLRLHVADHAQRMVRQAHQRLPMLMGMGHPLLRSLEVAYHLIPTHALALLGSPRGTRTLILTYLGDSMDIGGEKAERRHYRQARIRSPLTHLCGKYR